MSTLETHAPRATASAPRRSGSGSFHPWLIPALVAAAWMLLIVAVHRLSPRTLVSFHGMLHAAIVEALLRPGGLVLPPDNPFFAGEPVAYYWFFHGLAAGLVRLFGMNVFHAMEALVVLSAGALVLVGTAIGRKLYHSTLAGLLIGYLVIAGANPLGIVFAMVRVARNGLSVLEDSPDHLWGVVHPLFSLVRYHDVGGLNGPLLSFYLNITSRPLALTSLLWSAFCLHRALREPRFAAWLWFALAFALMTAFSPIIGLAAAGAFGFALVAAWLWQRYRPGPMAPRLGPGLIGAAACSVFAGIALAAPTFYHLLIGPSSSQAAFFLFTDEGVWHLVSVTLSITPLVILALLGIRRAPLEDRQYLQVLLWSGLALLGMNLTITLPDGNGSNTFHAAAVLLAIPAAGAILGRSSGSRPGSVRPRFAAFIVLLFLPTTLAVLASFLRRPPVPAEFDHTYVERTPRDSDLAQLYRWSRQETSAQSVFVIDPRPRVTMGGNVAEFPALTGRSILVEQPDHYMVAPFPDARARFELAVRLVTGIPADERDRQRLAALHRPVFLVIDAAPDSELAARLRALYGAPAFQHGRMAAYQLTPSTSLTSARARG